MALVIPLRKAGGPYIGPRGGRWADPQHTIPWKEPEQKASRPELKALTASVNKIAREVAELVADIPGLKVAHSFGEIRFFHEGSKDTAQAALSEALNRVAQTLPGKYPERRFLNLRGPGGARIWPTYIGERGYMQHFRDRRAGFRVVLSAEEEAATRRDAFDALAEKIDRAAAGLQDPVETMEALAPPEFSPLKRRMIANAHEDLNPFVSDWVFRGDSEAKSQLLSAWHGLDHATKNALADDVERVVREHHGGEYVTVYRSMRPGDRDTDRAGMSASTDPKSRTGQDVQAFQVHHSQILLHWAQEASWLNSKTYRHEREVILKPGVTIPAAQREPLGKALYIGPRGGKWADPQHTIPYDAEKHGPKQLTLGVESSRRKPSDSLTYFASGTNRAGEIRGFSDIGHPIGVEVREMLGREQATEELLNAKVPVFVDSGAFHEVAETPDGLVTVAPIDDAEWRRRLEFYQLVAERLGGQATLVAPDKIADPMETLARMRRYRDQVQRLAATGAKVLVVLQGADKVAFWHQALEALGLGPEHVTPAMPMKKNPTPPAEILRFVREVKPRGIHLLGLGATQARARKIALALDQVTQQAGILDFDLSLDSGRIRANVGTTPKPGPLMLAKRAARAELEEYRWSEGAPKGAMAGGAAAATVKLPPMDYTEAITAPAEWLTGAARNRIARALSLDKETGARWSEDPDAFLQAPIDPEDPDGAKWYEHPIMGLALDQEFAQTHTEQLGPEVARRAIVSVFGKALLVVPIDAGADVTRLEYLGKAGPYIGPKGGKWADPQHKIPWKDTRPHPPAATHAEPAWQRPDWAGEWEDQAGIPFPRNAEHLFSLYERTQEESLQLDAQNLERLDRGEEPDVGAIMVQTQKVRALKNLVDAIPWESYQRRRPLGRFPTGPESLGSSLAYQRHLGRGLEGLGKGGPYIGPRGGKWKDPDHKIPWDEGEGKPGGGGRPAGVAGSRSPEARAAREVIAGLKSLRDEVSREESKLGILETAMKRHPGERMYQDAYVEHKHRSMAARDRFNTWRDKALAAVGKLNESAQKAPRQAIEKLKLWEPKY